MKRLTRWFVCSIIWGSAAWGADLPSSQLGEQLFGSTQLGTSGKSCASCHPGGKGLEESAASSDKELTATINSCISGPLAGKPLDPESIDMKSLLLYLRSLAGGGR